MVNQYEIEMRLRDAQGNERLLTRTEHAYHVEDALKQSCYNVVPQLKAGESVKGILHIGPPAELVRASAQMIVAEVEEALRRISAREKK